MVTFGAPVDGGEDDFLDQQPDQGDGDFMSDDDDFQHQQPGQAEEEDYSMSDDDDDHCSDDDADDDFWSDADDDDGYWSAQGDHEDDESMADADEDEEAEYPFPVNAPPAAASEAAIAALETAEAPGDDCCPVCLQQDGGGEATEPEPAAARPWSRVAPCGHRFHAACVDKWLKVKLTCPVCRCPAAAPPAAPAAAARPIPGIVDEFLAVGFEESFVFDKTQRWNEFVDNPHRHITWNSSWEVS